MPGQLDGVHREPAAAQRVGHRPEVHRVAAGVGEADQARPAAAGRLRRGPAAARRCRSALPSISAARSASTGWRVMSLSDTARSSATASFTADSDVPPRSKKWSRRPICSTGTPSTVAHAAASRCSVGVAGRLVRPRPRRRRARRPAPVSAFLSILLLAVSGSAVPPVERRRAPCSRAARRRAARAAASTGERPVGGVEGHQVLAPAGPLGDDHGAVAHTGHAQQGVLDLADLDPEPGDLHLAVPAAEELQLAVRAPAAEVAAPVEPLAGAVRVGAGRPAAVRSGSLM